MIIGIDATVFLAPVKTGVEKTTCDLISKIIERDQTNTYWLYSNKPIPDKRYADNVKNIIVTGEKFWTQYYLSRELKNNPPDVFWAPSHMLPNFLPAKSVATVHDLAWRVMPSIYSWSQRLFSWLTVKRASKNATKLIAVSEQTKTDLIKYFNIPAEKIEVIYHALPNNFVDQKQAVSTISIPYLLFVGRIEARKNILNIIKAYHEFSKNNPAVNLVLAGPLANHAGIAKAMINKLNLEDRITFLDYVNKQEIFSLYTNSVGFVFPSLYEGFGVPILEAFAANVPVITSNTGAMAEVADSAALLVDPNNISEIAMAMNEIVKDTNLRNSLIQKGQTRLLDFSWEKSADKMINLWAKL